MRATDQVEEVVIGPNPGPQSEAFASSATITVFGGQAGGGKALCVTTPIATPGGWSTMGELSPGDFVFAPDGTCTRVLSCSDVQHGRECFDVEFSDGVVITADGDHLWWTFTHSERAAMARSTPEARAKRRARRPSRSKGTRPHAAAVLSAMNASRAYDLKPTPAGGIRTTAEIARTLTARRGTHSNHSVPVAQPIVCDVAGLPLDPYVLGLWLGDGTASTGVITKPDVEIDEHIERAGFKARRVKSAPMSIRVFGLTAKLRDMGLVGDKRIPRDYLRASLDQRLALAQGMLDTDGHASPIDGAIEWTTTTPALATDMLELVHTLGCKATLIEGRATLDGRDCGPKWRISFMSGLPMFRLARKLDKQKRDGFRGTHDNRYIVAVRPRASVPVRCILVEHPSHCFLAGRDMVPTHNTHLTLLRMAVHADQHPDYAGIIFRREAAMITQGGGLWEEAMRLYPVWRAVPNWGNFSWRFPNRSLIQMRGLQYARDVLNYQGAQLAEFALEEATHFEESQFWYLFSRLRTTCGLRARCMMTCNPDPDSWVRKLIDWWIGPDGFAMPERAGVKRFFLRDGDALIWGDSKAEVRAKAPHLKQDPISIRFIPSALSDNPKGDPDYRNKLEALPMVERERLLGGNWNVRAVSGSYFRRGYFEVVDRIPGAVVRRVRAWDLAATEPSETNKDPDWTVGLLVAELADGRYVVEHAERLRGTPGTVDETLRNVAAQDGIGVTQLLWQDPGQAGKSQRDAIIRLLSGHRVKFVVASENKETYAGPVSSDAEHGKILLLRGPWNDAFLASMEAFPLGKHDDDVDAMSRAHLELAVKHDDSGSTRVASSRR